MIDHTVGAPIQHARRTAGAAGTIRWLSACGGVLVLGAALSVTAPDAIAAEAVRENQVSFAATATLELPLDTLTVTLRAQRDGTEAATVQSQIKQVLDQALTEARRQASPEAMEVSTGSFNLNPRYNRDGKPNGWTGSADLILQGRDVARVAATAGKLTGMNIVSTGYSLSRPLREKSEAELSAQAIQKFRARAGEVARQFGFNGYTLGEINVQSVDNDGGGRPPVYAMKAMAAPMADGAPMPSEPGKGSLSVTVQGSITLTR